MFSYIARRLLLLPITLFFIVLVNFVIINLAPGEPTTITEVTAEGGATRKEGKAAAFGSDDRYLQFREFYGLTLPILWNSWPFLSQRDVEKTLHELVTHKKNSKDQEDMSVKDYESRRITFGDQARFVMPRLLKVVEDPAANILMRQMAIRFFVRGGTRQAILGPGLSTEEKSYNQTIGQNNEWLLSMLAQDSSGNQVKESAVKLREWYDKNKIFYNFEPTFFQKAGIFFFETRFFRYLSRVFALDFGTLRNDSNKTVVYEVAKRFKYSLTLSLLPMLITFIFCQIIGAIMACSKNKWPDKTLNLLCLFLYAIPIFVVAPFLIEKVGLNGRFPFTNLPIPISGFTSPDSIYSMQNSYQRLFDILSHIALPLVAILYGSLAAQSRLSRTAILETLHQDYVTTARAKGVSKMVVLLKHVGRNASITIVTSIAGSLGVVLGGSLIVETLFDINGFGKFFYDAVLNRDYNVIMFSALAGSFLTLIGYLAADLAYMALDPRITLD